MIRAVGAAIALLLVVGVAGAEELQGKVKSVDQAGHSFALEDGSQIWLAEGLSMVTLREGASIKAVYEERDGKKIATSVTNTPSAKERSSPAGAITSAGGRAAPTRR
jgi:hypothetical protein